MGFSVNTINSAGTEADNELYGDTTDRMTATLSDGTLVAAIRRADSPATIPVYTSSDNGVTWTLRVTMKTLTSRMQ